MIDFVSLHNHTQASLLHSLITVKDLFGKAKELGQSSIAIADYGTCAAMWDGLKISRDTGVKFIAGCECYFVDDVENKNEKLRYVVLLAKNAVGYSNILKLNRAGFDHSSMFLKKIFPVIDWKLLEKHSDGVICLTGCGNGIFGQLLNDKKFEQAEETLKRLYNIFGDNLGVEVQSHNMSRAATAYLGATNQFFTNAQAIRIAKKHGLRIVPTTNAHYLKKEDSEVHDVMLAIASMQPVYSNNRIKYNVPDLYMKTGDEVMTFFARNNSEEFAKEICANTLYFADKCEKPDWIEPKVLCGGSLFPVFDVKSESDYDNFINWKNKQNDNVKKLDEDSAYLRFKCELKLVEKKLNNKIYIERLDEELEVLDYQKFSSYLLIVADYVNWARNNGVSVGPGRGCLKGDTLVLTSNGYKELKDIQVGELVYTHSGDMNKVLNTHIYDIDEEIISLKTMQGFKPISLTKEHKVLASKLEIVENPDDTYHTVNSEKFKVCSKQASWIEAKDIVIGDYIFTPFLNIKSEKYDNIIDLNKFNNEHEFDDDNIYYRIKNTNSKLSAVFMSDIFHCDELRIGTVRRGLSEEKKHGKVYKDKDGKLKAKITNYLDGYGVSFEYWQKYGADSIVKMKRHLPIDEDLAYLMGRWVGDGCFDGNRGLNIAFNESDKIGRDKIRGVCDKFGINYSTYKHKNAHCKVIIIRNRIIYSLFKNLFPNYNNTSSTKHMPNEFRNYPINIIKQLLLGLTDSDGHIYEKKNRENLVSTSKILALQVKEMLLYLGVTSSIVEQKHKELSAKGYVHKTSYHLSFCGLKLERKELQKLWGFFTEKGFFTRVIDVSTLNLTKVYDIETENDHSYLTTSGIVHNSAGGSLIGYLLDIHKADPIKYGLIFARFQNKERKSPPDIDLDFAGIGRDKVINYIKQKYGENNVASISNLNRITPKVYARDLSRSCDLAGNRADSVMLGNNIADSIPVELKNNLSFDDVNQAPLFSEYCKRYPKLLKNNAILGITRNYSSHAAAIVIANKPISGVIPLRRDKDGAVVVEYEKNTSEENGLLKMDILGLSTLDLIDSTIELINKSGKKLDPNYLNYDCYDKLTYDLITSGNTYGVFQFGVSGGTIDLCKKIKPKSIDDLSIITTLARPASKNIRKDFIDTKEGKRKFNLLHPSLKNAFEGTFGFGLYDESILTLAQDVAGWSLHSADRLRKMVKEKSKNPERDEKLRLEFIEGAVGKGIERKMAIRIWDEEVGKFALYSFPRAHATLYSFLSYTTAFLKAHYPTEFLLANLMAEIKSNAPNAKENVDKIKQELKHFGIKVFPPNINTSPFSYQIQNDNSLITGLDALKFVGDEAIQDIIAKRPFTNFDDFMTRVDSKKVRATTIQALAASGALDCFGLSRKIMFLYCQDYRKKLQVWQKKHKDEPFAYPYPVEKEWTKSELYALEKNYLSESFTYTKDEGFCGYFGNNAFKFVSINDLQNKERVSPVKAEIKSIFIFKVKKEGSKYLGKDMAKVLLEDKYGDQLTMTIFPDKWQIVQDRAKYIGKGKIKFDSGAAISFMGTVNEYDNEKNLILDEFLDITAAPALPKDLKAKKLSLKRKKSKDELVLIENKIDPGSQEAIAEELEDDLFFEGFIELDGEDSEDD